MEAIDYLNMLNDSLNFYKQVRQVQDDVMPIMKRAGFVNNSCFVLNIMTSDGRVAAGMNKMLNKARVADSNQYGEAHLYSDIF